MQTSNKHNVSARNIWTQFDLSETKFHSLYYVTTGHWHLKDINMYIFLSFFQCNSLLVLVYI
jgi:hypothetical protein